MSRRSPSGSGAQLSGEREEPTSGSMHPFLDVEKADFRAVEPGSSLLGDWVPGVSVRSDQLSDQKEPPHASAQSTGPTALGLNSTYSSRRGSTKHLWWAVSLSLLSILGISYFALGGKYEAAVNTPLAAIGENESREDFVRIEGTQFMLDCRPFYIAGFNAHDLVPKALATPAEHKTFEGRNGKELAQELLRNASSYGLNVARIYAHTADDEHPFMVKPGEYNSDALKTMDYILDTARGLGLKVMLSFADNWKWQGGVDQMLEWSKTVKKRTQSRPAEQNGDFDDQVLDVKTKEYEVARHSLFFNDTDARRIYKEYVKSIITRENTVNGRTYSQDPTIMSWGLLNEPRCETWLVPECKQTFQSWVEEMSAFVKSLDPTHLVTIGSEGFFGEDSIKVKSNPQTWGSQIGQDFTANHMPKSIDYLTVHMWPDNWQRQEKSYQREWLQAHMDVAKKTLKKPLVLEEFGKKLIAGEDNVLFEQAIDQLRNPVFDITYQMVEEALQKGQPLQGSLFWRWDLIIYEDQRRADYGVRTYDTTFGLIKSHASFVSQLQASHPPAASCKLQCWVPTDSGNRCVNVPKECSSQLRKKKKGSKPTYPTRKECCRAGMGAFSEGCNA